MDNLWERMNHLYGHKWSSAYGELASDANGELTETASTWARGLNGLAGQELAHGLEGCVSRSDPWPPSLPEFRALCKPQPVENAKMYETPPELLALPEPKEARDARRAKGKAAAQMLKSHVRRLTGTTAI